MPSAALHPPTATTSSTTSNSAPPNPLPTLLHTPLGLAILEIQGSLNMPYPSSAQDDVMLIDGPGSSSRDGGGKDDGFGGKEKEKEKEKRKIGRLVFPLLESGRDGGVGNGGEVDEDGGRCGGWGYGGGEVKEGPWMKKVWLFVGENQRLTGEVRKLERKVGVVRRAGGGGGGGNSEDAGNGDAGKEEGRTGVELEIVDVVGWKVFFGNRPEFV